MTENYFSLTLVGNNGNYGWSCPGSDDGAYNEQSVRQSYNLESNSEVMGLDDDGGNLRINWANGSNGLGSLRVSGSNTVKWWRRRSPTVASRSLGSPEPATTSASSRPPPASDPPAPMLYRYAITPAVSRCSTSGAAVAGDEGAPIRGRCEASPVEHGSAEEGKKPPLVAGSAPLEPGSPQTPRRVLGLSARRRVQGLWRLSRPTGQRPHSRSGSPLEGPRPTDTCT